MAASLSNWPASAQFIKTATERLCRRVNNTFGPGHHPVCPNVPVSRHDYLGWLEDSTLRPHAKRRLPRSGGAHRDRFRYYSVQSGDAPSLSVSPTTGRTRSPNWGRN